MRVESFGFALSDGMSAVKSDPAYLKAYYRRAAALMSLGKFKGALIDLEYVSVGKYGAAWATLGIMILFWLVLQVAKVRPSDESAKIKFNECKKIVKMQAFERAIASDTSEKTLAELHTDLELIGK